MRPTDHPHIEMGGRSSARSRLRHSGYAPPSTWCPVKETCDSPNQALSSVVGVEELEELLARDDQAPAKLDRGDRAVLDARRHCPRVHPEGCCCLDTGG